MSESASKSPKRPRGLLKSKKAGKAAEDDGGRSSKRLKTDHDAGDAEVSVDSAEKLDVTLEDWEDLKELFENSLEALEGENPLVAAPPLLRGILHECDRFIRHHPDPTTVYESSQDSKLAFAAIHGSALFYMARIISVQPDIASAGEPQNSSSWFEAALKIFESATEGRDNKTTATELDRTWRARLEFTWGLAILEKQDEEADEGKDGENGEEENAQKIDSAASHFSKGVKHLAVPLSGDDSAPKARTPLRPAQTLITAADALYAACQEISDEPEQARKWYNSILETLLTSQFDNSSATTEDERAELALLRGKCWSAIATSHAEECEEGLAEEDETAWNSEAATAGREAFNKAINLFRGVLKASNQKERDEESEAETLLGEALLSLGNLTEDEKAREKLYSEAKEYGVDVDAMDE
ncbi:hypothetical protein M407DRAFT_244351 [Tulasnella calospora MUT 4182]|uniref:Enhancer of translation termination 1 n=1 Tax=Tulasnella calospora MUT 4182 TaxID=1051891 RepID=A0A0C3QGL6_9AGAM|nr:hypothetical protein M407DRAFT_244351 [Tulasnella calospora MUT 4182]